MMLNTTCPCPCCGNYGTCECDYGNMSNGVCRNCSKCQKHCKCAEIIQSLGIPIVTMGKRATTQQEVITRLVGELAEARELLGLADELLELEGYHLDDKDDYDKFRPSFRTTLRNFLDAARTAQDVPWSHFNTPPGFKPCTRPDGHEGPCALADMEAGE